MATLWALSLVCLLHVRGGVSAKVTIQRHGALSSPRPWRCFYNPALARGSFLVFSTSVEVFPVAGRTRSASGCLLHVRGGVSLGNFEVGATTGSSPRPWRCFQVGIRTSGRDDVFSTSVEVFPCRSASEKSRQQSSPRPWRCFFRLTVSIMRWGVFSTSVEVFPTALTLGASFAGLLHVRGGVSKKRHVIFAGQRSSPRPWRCF